MKAKKKPLVVALGNFDGVHLGHQTILKAMIQYAQKKRWGTAVYTFEPHPAKILAPGSAPLLIQTLDQKITALKKLGIQRVVVEKFNISFSHMPHEKFFEKIVIKKLRARGIWIGYDFTFGFKRKGTTETLKNLCTKYNLLIIITKPKFKKENFVSSTQIRRLITGGNIQLANELLGKPFALIGRVVKGHGIGTKMGIHTANLKVENELLPKVGIYITKTRVGTKTWPSATSVGFNPTFPGKGFSVETHLIGFDGNLRGKKIEVEFLKWLREELTFPNIETLAVQIKKDIHEALRYHR